MLRITHQKKSVVQRKTYPGLTGEVVAPDAVGVSGLFVKRKNTHQLRRLQDNVMTKIFKHDPSASIEACEALTGLQPIDIYCESIAVKFAIKIRQNDDLVRDTHMKPISKPHSRANSLESSLTRYGQFMNKETILEYTNDQIAGFISDQWRWWWERGFNNSFLTNLTASLQALTMSLRWYAVTNTQLIKSANQTVQRYIKRLCCFLKTGEGEENNETEPQCQAHPSSNTCKSLLFNKSFQRI